MKKIVKIKENSVKRDNSAEIKKEKSHSKHFEKLRSKSRLNRVDIAEGNMPKNCEHNSNDSNSLENHLENCDCADVASKRVDELHRMLQEAERQVCQDQEELVKLRAEVASSREPKPTNLSTDGGLERIFRNFATSLESAISSRQMRFEDVEKSFKTFDGSKSMNVSKWISNFEEQADLLELNNFQRFVYAKRLMRDTAKLFVDHESKAVSWADLLDELNKEFGKRVNSASVHNQLREMRKKADESITQYLYKMIALADQANIDKDALISYVVDGLPGSMELKVSLYEAKGIPELKGKLLNYETLLLKQQKQRQNPQRVIGGTKPRDFKPKPTDDGKRACYLCGDPTHMISECPRRSSGPRCFKCGEYGHVIKFCTSGEPSKSINCIKQCSSETHIWVSVNGEKFHALVDTGSHYTVIREDLVKRINCRMEDLFLEGRVKGVGGYTNLKSKFPAIIKIDEDTHSTQCYVIGKESIDDEMIIGLDIILKCKMELSPKGLFLKKLEDDDQEELQEVFDELCAINFILDEEQHGVDLSHIQEKPIREEVNALIRNYTPREENHCPIEMQIILTDEEPIYLKPKRVSPKEKCELDAQIKQWQEDGVIRDSFSDYAAQVLFVPKKDGTKRLCVDFRPLNKKLIKDRFPIPHLEEQLDLLQCGRVFSKLDLKNGYFHVPVSERSRKYTAFVTHSGQYEFNRVPFGLSTSPAVFCRFIRLIFRDLIAKGIALTYMDDVIIIAKDEKEAVERLKTVLDVAASYNLNIKWQKCELLKKRIEYLGQEIHNGTIRSSEGKVKCVNNYPEPKNIKQIQKFLGFANYFRKFIGDFAWIAKPLNDLMKKNVEFKFGDAQKEAFRLLKQKIIERPILSLYQPDAETELHTDASKWATAAILMQKSKDDDEFHPVAFASKRTTACQEKWFSYELELYAVYLAVKKFRNFLLDIKFTIVTDCQAIKSAKEKKDVRKVAAWLMELQEFDFSITHRPGSKMQHVDALSRMYVLQTPSLTHQLKQAQDCDERIQAIKQILNEREFEDYVMYNGLLCKYANSSYLIVVPREMEMSIIMKAHRLGHFKRSKLEAIITKEFFIPGLPNKIDAVVRNCIECILCDRKEGKKEGFLHSINKEPLPLDTFHLDHLGPLPTANRSFVYILAIVDAFTKFVWLFPTRSVTAEETLKKLKIVTNIFGNPRRIIADKGSAFRANLFQDFCNEQNIEVILCTAGVPRGNGQVERIHRIVIAALAKLSFENPEEWYEHIDDVQRILNTTMQRAINVTPFKLMFGVEMNQNDSDVRRIIEHEIMEDFCDEREQIRNEAKESILKIQQENKRTFNKNRKEARKYEINDLVAINKTQFSTASKLKPKFLGPYKVTVDKGNERYEMEKVGVHDGPNKTSSSADNMKGWPEMQNILHEPSINMIRGLPIKMNKCVTIFIEGNIGAGKSTLLERFAKYDFIKIYQEPVEKWQNFKGFNLLEMSYENPERYAFLFQSYAFLTMLRRHTEGLEAGKLNMMERSVLSNNYCFMKAAIENKLVEPPFAAVFQEWFDFTQKNFQIEPDLIVYLRTSPDVLIQRIKERGRTEEQNINFAQLKQLHDIHENWIKQMQGKYQVLTINADLALDEKVLGKIFHFIKNHCQI